MPLFGKPKSTASNIPQKRKGVPDGQWVKCEDCGEIIYKKTLDENFKVCPKCNFHFTLSAYERINQFGMAFLITLMVFVIYNDAARAGWVDKALKIFIRQ